MNQTKQAHMQKKRKMQLGGLCIYCSQDITRRTSEIYDENTPTMIVPRTTSAIGMQTATEQMISKIDEKE